MSNARSALFILGLGVCLTLGLGAPAHAQINVITVDCTPFVSPGNTSFGLSNTMGMSLVMVDTGGLFNVTEVTPQAFRAMTAAQLAAFDLIAINNNPIRISDNCVPGNPGLGTTWHGVIGINNGGRVHLNSHDAARFKIIVPPFSTVFSAACPGCEPFAADDLVRQAALWTGGGTQTGLLIFNDSARFFTVGGSGWNNPELNLPAAWGISDSDQFTFSPAGFVDGGYTDILPAFTGHPIYAGLTDARLAPNSVSSFAANVVDDSFHSIFNSFSGAIFSPTEVMINAGIIDVGGFNAAFGFGTNVAPPGPDGLAISLIRNEIVCGNGIVEPGEQCDDAGESAACNADCTFAACGDGILNLTAGEVCDDGNLVDGDGCDSNCTPTACGNGIVTAGEACDDGNLIDGDGCDSNCTPTGCGNAVVTPPETCDDGNLIDGDGCDSNCTPTSCGNGIVTPPEECDDGNNIDGDGCQGNCRLPFCGDGIVDPGEGCDDGNNIDLDGCSANCRPEGACCSNGPGIESDCFITNDIDCATNHSLYLGDGAVCTNDIDCVALAVTMDSMSAEATPQGVLIRWTTALEIDTIGFRVLRETAGPREKALGVVAEMIPASGHGLGGASYEILDDSVASDSAIHYYIEDIDISGKLTRHGPIMIDRGVRQAPTSRGVRGASQPR